MPTKKSSNSFIIMVKISVISDHRSMRALISGHPSTWRPKLLAYVIYLRILVPDSTPKMMSSENLQRPLGTLHHLCFSVSDYQKSTEFYDSLLTKLADIFFLRFDDKLIGYTVLVKKEFYTSWFNANVGQIAISPIKPEFKDKKHDKFSIGIRLALNATSRKEIDEFHDFLVKKNYKVLDAPKEYNYVPGYYAVTWEDPDGMELELCYVPITKSSVLSEGKRHDDSVKEDDRIGCSLTIKYQKSNACRVLHISTSQLPMEL
ncbi:17179_t:CDS:2 [Acaulospora morrowiae]|uniref:17179_t:CDS:1 n=1 Tax=Acaulospora morrowiae TaxID=94023 RepID=A0A9N9EDQ0_9GLOM|nr:17179_t:CDS:2 [Acaulospora morrowiae]